MRLCCVMVVCLGSTVALFAQELADTVRGISFVMKWVEGGEFEMGCSEEQGCDCWRQEAPVHRVTVGSFYVGETEVTQRLWAAVMGEGGNWAGQPFCADCPVHGISWPEAQAFLRELNRLTGRKYRLPREAEWEFAARGGKRGCWFKFAGSPSLDEVGWYGELYGTARPVAGKLPNELGLYDMSGNVWEWCEDRYGLYERRKVADPKGPQRGKYRVIRGGCWYYACQFCRVTYRTNQRPDDKQVGVGFRLALSVEKRGR